MEETRMANALNPELLELTAKIVSAHVGQNHLPAAALPELIQSVYRSLATAGTVKAVLPPPTPAVPVRRSVFPDHLVCLEDGLKLKMLKRHLKTSYGMTPEQYRQKWDLPPSYPMVAPSYANKRSKLAKQSGLGRGGASAKPAESTETGKAAAPPELPEATPEPVVTQVAARRARGYRG